MEIKTKHRKSAEQNRPKGRALFALAERKEAPYAAMFAALTLAMAAYVKSAFGGTPQIPDQGTTAPEKSQAQQDAIPHQVALEPIDGLVDFSEGRDDRPVITGVSDEGGDLGRIGRGPGMLDLSRFFPDADPTIDLPHAYLVDQPDIDGTNAQPDLRQMPNLMSGGTGAGGGALGGGSLANGDGGGSAGPGGPDGEDGADAMAGVNFHALFAQLASVVRPFHPTTVREISDLAIGDWVSQHELYRLRGGETRADLDAAYLAREARTYDLVSNPDSREAFIDQHFPEGGTNNAAMPEASLAEDVTAAAMQPEPLLSTDTNTGLL